MKKIYIGILSDRPIRKIEFIGIGRYEKKLIGRTLMCTPYLKTFCDVCIGTLFKVRKTELYKIIPF